MKKARLKKQVLDWHVRQIRKDVSVHFVSEKKMMDVHPAPLCSLGSYDGNVPRIYVLKSMPNYRKFAVLLHEYGHFLHDMNDCRCRNYDKRSGERFNPVLSETHAGLFCLTALYEGGFWDCLQYEKKAITTYWNAYPYNQARQRLMKSKIWKLRRKR